MKMKSILLLMLVLCLTVCLCACGSKDDAKNDAPTTTTTNNTTTTTTTTASTTTTTTAPSKPVENEPTQPEEGKATYTITVVDEAGNPIPGAMVQMCDDTSCLVPVLTNAQGIAVYENKDEANYSVKFATVPEGYVLPVDENGQPAGFYFDEGSYEITITLKAAN